MSHASNPPLSRPVSTDRRRSRSEQSGFSSDGDDDFYDADEYEGGVGSGTGRLSLGPNVKSLESANNSFTPQPPQTQTTVTTTTTQHNDTAIMNVPSNGTHPSLADSSQPTPTLTVINTIGDSSDTSSDAVSSSIPTLPAPAFQPSSSSHPPSSAASSSSSFVPSISITAPPVNLPSTSTPTVLSSPNGMAPAIPPRPRNSPQATPQIMSRPMLPIQPLPQAQYPSSTSAAAAAANTTIAPPHAVASSAVEPPPFTIKNLDTGESCELDAASSVFPEVRATMTLSSFDEARDGKMNHHDQPQTPAMNHEEVTEKKKTLGFMSRLKKALHLSDKPDGNGDHLPNNSVKVKTKHRSFQDLSDVKLVQTLEQHAGPIWSVAISSQGEFIATGGQDSIVRIWAVMGSTAAKELDDRLRTQKAQQEAAAAAAQAQAAAASVGASSSYDAASQAHHLPTNASSNSSVASSTDSTTAPGGTTPIEVPNFEQDYPKDSGCRPIVYPVPYRSYAGHKADVIDLAWSKANFLLSASIDKTVRLWHVSRQKCLCVFQHADFVTAVCFPEFETRVMTDDGFLYLDEIEERMARAEAGDRPPLRFASYDIARQEIVYGPGEIVFSRPPEQLVDFTQAATRQLWNDETSERDGANNVDGAPSKTVANDYANHLSLLVTPNHRMYVQVGDEADNGTLRLRTNARGEELPFRTVAARELTSSHAHPSASSSRTQVVMQVRAPNGFTPVKSLFDTNDADAAHRSSPVTRLQLHTSQQLDAFLQLYGYWLGSGSLIYATSASVCDDAHEHVCTGVRVELGAMCDVAHVRRVCSDAQLVEGASFTIAHHSSSATHLIIHHPDWTRFFDAEHSTKFDSGEHAQWLMPWVLTHLDARQVRLLLDGLLRASNDSTLRSASLPLPSVAPSRHEVHTTSVLFRDQLQQACMHAGYSTHCQQRRPSTAIAPGSAEGAQVSWTVSFYEETTATLPMSDIVYDEPSPSAALDSSLPPRPSCPYNAKSHGRIWCVKVAHPDHLLIAQRARRDVATGVVTQSSQPAIVGNCFHPIEDRYFVSGSFDKKLRIWNIPEHRVVEWAQTSNIITAATFNPNGNMTVAGLYNGQCVFYLTDGLKYHTQVDAKNRCFSVDSQLLTPSGPIAAGCVTKSTRLIDSGGESQAVMSAEDDTSTTMFTVAYEIPTPGSDKSQPSSHVVTPDHLVTLRWELAPQFGVTRSSASQHRHLRIQCWTIDSNYELKRFVKSFRFLSPSDSLSLSPSSSDSAFLLRLLPPMSDASALSFGRRWLASAAAVGKVEPLWRGDLIDVRVDNLHRWMARDTQLAASLRLPIVPTDRDTDTQPIEVDGEVPSHRIPSTAASVMEEGDKGMQSVDPDVASSFDFDATENDDDTHSIHLDDTHELNLLANFCVEHGIHFTSFIPDPSSHSAIPIASSSTLSHVSWSQRYDEVLLNAERTLLASDLDPSSSLAHDFIRRATVQESGAIRYDSITPRDTIDDVEIAYMVEHPSMMTDSRLEQAWTMIDRGEKKLNVLIAAMNCITILTDDTDLRESQYDSLCKSTMELALSSMPNTILAFGRACRDRWLNDWRSLSNVLDGHPSVTCDGFPCLRLSVVPSSSSSSSVASSKVVTILFAPAPSRREWAAFDVMVEVMASAHGLELTASATRRALASMSDLVLHARVTRITKSADGTFPIKKITVASRDSRLALADRVLTHNSGKYSKGKKVTGMQFAPDGKSLLVTTNDSRIRLYSMEAFDMIAKLKGTENDELQIRAWFNSDGSKVICGGENQHVYIWSTAEYLGIPDGHNSPTALANQSKPDVKCDSSESFRAFNDTVTSAQFLPNNTIRLSTDDSEVHKVKHLIIAAGYDGDIKFFENRGNRKLC